MIRGRRSGAALRALLALSAAAILTACGPSASPGDPTLEALIAEQHAQATRIQSQSEFISYLATRIPPPRFAPSLIPSPTPFVTGSVSIEDGRCCVGAAAGSTILVNVSFVANSPMAPVTEMRVRAGSQAFDETSMAEADWEPFRTRAAYPFVVPLNWVGFYVSVQFRDGLGNPSAVVHDDISVEGMPPLPSGTP